MEMHGKTEEKRRRESGEAADEYLLISNRLKLSGVQRAFFCAGIVLERHNGKD